MSEDFIKDKFEDHERRLRLLEENNKLLIEISCEVKNMKQDVGEINKKLKDKDETTKKDIKGWITFILQTILTILLGFMAIKLGLK